MSWTPEFVPNVNMAALLWSSATPRALHPLVIERTRTATYADVRRRTSALATAIRGAGVGRQQRVAILLERGAEAVAAIFACYAAGAVAVVVNDRLRPRQIEHVLGHSGAQLLLTTRDMIVRQPRPLVTSARVVDLETVPDEVADGSFEPEWMSATDFAHIIYTSGSTGLPKGVTFTHGQLRAGVDGVRGYLGIRADDRTASLLAFSAVYGLNQLFCTVATGSTLVVETSPVPSQVVRTLRECGVTVAAAVPPLWLQLLTVPAFAEEPIPSLRLMQNAGGHCPVDAVRRLRAAQPQAQLFLQYGMTEAFRSTFLPPDEVDAHPDSMGRAMPGAEILVLREDDTPCDVGEVGELVFRGPTVAAGYWNDPEGTARTFRPNPLLPAGAPSGERVIYSGDMVRRDSDGLLYFVSRRDRMIKILGFRVGPDEIADVLYASGQIAEGVVVGEADPQNGQRIVAHVVLKADGSLGALRDYCRVELPRHMQPARFEVRDAIPRMASGKYDVLSMTQPAATQPPA